MALRVGAFRSKSVGSSASGEIIYLCHVISQDQLIEV